MNNQDIIDLFERSGIVLRGCTYEPHKVIEFVNACLEYEREACAKVVHDYADSIRLFQNESQLIEAERRIRVIGQADTNTKGTHE